MNKIAIPTILLATVLAAGIFAFMPVEQASTVHLSNTLTLAAGGIGVGDFAAGAITAAAIDDAVAPQVVPLAGCTTLFDDDITDNPSITVDKDFTLYLLAEGTNALTLTITGLTGGTYVHTFTTTQLAQSFVIHAAANEVISIDGSTAAVDVSITVMSQSGAVGDCIV